MSRRSTRKPRRRSAISTRGWIKRTARRFITVCCLICSSIPRTRRKRWPFTTGSCALAGASSRPNALLATPSCSKSKIIPTKPSSSTPRLRSCSRRRTATRTRSFAGSGSRSLTRKTYRGSSGLRRGPNASARMPLPLGRSCGLGSLLRRAAPPPMRCKFLAARTNWRRKNGASHCCMPRQTCRPETPCVPLPCWNRSPRPKVTRLFSSPIATR